MSTRRHGRVRARLSCDLQHWLGFTTIYVTHDQVKPLRHRLVFRTKRSSTQHVVDRAFRGAGVRPKPEIVLDTRDGVFEAVANGLGVGFTWEHGSSCTDKIVRVQVPEMSTQVPDHIFCLSGKRYKLVELFFETPKAIKHMTA